MTKRIIMYGLLFVLAISLGVLNISCTNDANAEVSNEFNKSSADSGKPFQQINQRLDTIVVKLDQIISKLNEPEPEYDVGVPKTGQTTTYATGDDGNLQMGAAWPNPRFTDNGDGTVTDNLTGLMWVQNAQKGGGVTWYNAIIACDGYVLAGYDDWRLPNVRELHSLTDYETLSLPEGHPFLRYNGYYWTSTSDPIYAFAVGNDGWVRGFDKPYDFIFYWPVRGGN